MKTETAVREGDRIVTQIDAALAADIAAAAASFALDAAPGAASAPAAGAATSPRLLLVSAGGAASDLSAVARAAGFLCECCELQRALPLLASNAYDAGLLDFGAPGPFLEFLEDVRATATRKIPLAAVVDAATLASAVRAGASFTIPRPVAPDLLKKTLSSLYGIAQSQRRRFKRHRVELPVRLTVDGATIEAQSIDIGSGGMALIAPVPLAVGSALTVRFLLPGTARTVVTEAEVRWADGHGRAGLEFVVTETIRPCAPESSSTTCQSSGSPPAPLSARETPVGAAPTLHPVPGKADRAGRLLLAAFLALFCISVVAFWIWMAASG